LTVQAKFYYNTLHASDKSKEWPASRQYLLDYFNQITESIKYDIINYNCFTEVSKSMRDSIIKTKKQHRVVDMKEEIEVSEPSSHVLQLRLVF
jgi:dihydrodipicolinate synthase/N-acetylneuraminate lyase